jgi:hypothetical protein
MGSANLIVVPLAADGAALLIEAALSLRPFSRCEYATVAAVANDRTVNPALLVLEAASLAGGELPGPQAADDPRLLVVLSTSNARDLSDRPVRR